MAKIVAVERQAVTEPTRMNYRGYVILTYPPGPFVRVHLELTDEELRLFRPVYTRSQRRPPFGDRITWPGKGESRRSSRVLIVAYEVGGKSTSIDELDKLRNPRT